MKINKDVAGLIAEARRRGWTVDEDRSGRFTAVTLPSGARLKFSHQTRGFDPNLRAAVKSLRRTLDETPVPVTVPRTYVEEPRSVAPDPVPLTMPSNMDANVVVVEDGPTVVPQLPEGSAIHEGYVPHPPIEEEHVAGPREVVTLEVLSAPRQLYGVRHILWSDETEDWICPHCQVVKTGPNRSIIQIHVSQKHRADWKDLVTALMQADQAKMLDEAEEALPAQVETFALVEDLFPFAVDEPVDDAVDEVLVPVGVVDGFEVSVPMRPPQEPTYWIEASAQLLDLLSKAVAAAESTAPTREVVAVWQERVAQVEAERDALQAKLDRLRADLA